MTHLRDYPEVCILIPCFNNVIGLKQSIQSIRYQTGKYIILVVDDGSTLPVTKEQLQLPAEYNAALIIIHLNQNCGITTALNTGLEYIRKNLIVSYIARLDCSDICHANRFFAQIKFLNQHSEVSLIGSWCTFKKADGSDTYNYTTPTGHDEIAKEMHFRNVFIHPTVMFRTDILLKTGLYPDEYPHAEDYALFWNMLNNGKTAILSELLVTCEINTSGISIRNRQAQLRSRYRLIKKYGSSAVLRGAGLLKLKLFMLIPYSIILTLKKIRN